MKKDRRTMSERCVEMRTFRRRRGWLVLLATMITAPGCAELPASAKQQLIDAYGAYTRKDPQSAKRTLDAFLSQYPEHPESAEAYYLRALCLAEASDKAQANTDAQQCIRLTHNVELAAKAHAMAGTLLMESGKTAAAIRHYSDALKGMPERPPTDLVRYRYATCLQREGDWRQARLEFAAVFQRYPTGALAEHARRMYDWPHDFFSIQCGAFRERRGADELASKLKRAGLDGRVEMRPRSGEPMNMVFVGRFPQYAQGEEALRVVQRQVAGAMIVP